MSSNRAPPSASAPYGTDTTNGLPSLGITVAAVGAVRAAAAGVVAVGDAEAGVDRKSTRLNSSHEWISYAVFCLKKKKIKNIKSIGSNTDDIKYSAQADDA